MNTTQQKRFYSPQFSPTASVSVRRFAWALGVPMTKAIDIIVEELSTVLFSSLVVCPQCQDKTKCDLCVFKHQQNTAKNPAVGV